MPYDPPPLTGLRVLELAGLAPAPFAGLALADYGATVLRIDPPSSPSQPPAPDLLTRHKSSLPINLKSPQGRALFLGLLPHADILIDPFRPLVLERLGLDPTTVLLKANPRLIVARIVGFRRDGPLALRAGHDINYLAASGVLSLLGRKGEVPYAPANLLADFGGGGMVAVVGILMALMARAVTGRGQVVEANMEDGVGYLGTMARLGRMGELDRGGAGSGRGGGVWNRLRGENLLDGGCPYYDCYETREGGYMAVGALEDKFFAELVRGLGVDVGEWGGDREDRATWPRIREVFKKTFMMKTRKEWEDVFEGKDACCTPVLSLEEMKDSGYQQRPMVTLRGSPGKAVMGRRNRGKDEEDIVVEDGQGDGVEGDGWSGKVLKAGEGGDEVLEKWTGWKKGVDCDMVDGGWIKIQGKSRL